MAEIAIDIEGLVKRFGDIVAVDNVSMRVDRGEIFGLLGPNGSGKTTLIHCLMGIYRFDGSVKVLGHPIPLNKLAARRKIGFMPQEIAIYNDLSPLENALFYGRIYGMEDESIRKRFDDLSHLLRLEEKRDRTTRTLSGGQKRRVSLGIALLTDPDLIILDEPTVGVDPLLRREFWKYFEELRSQGKTLLITTHITDEALRVDRVGMMLRGKLIVTGPPKELMASNHVDSLEDLFIHYEGGTK
ncbi:MAG: ABC transporter ATP-binding protein [Methanomassiliicoccales archaeon]